mmetsp:Transcript_7537/g.20652  ORF Transcript_7537/g.20652 Transcript_7537/m.20652 type:complete len:99 (+) Transcript_7537:765-1061(+)
MVNFGSERCVDNDVRKAARSWEEKDPEKLPVVLPRLPALAEKPRPALVLPPWKEAELLPCLDLPIDPAVGAATALSLSSRRCAAAGEATELPAVALPC